MPRRLRALTIGVSCGLMLCGMLELGVRGYSRATGRGFATPIVDDEVLGFALRPHFQGVHWDAEVQLDENGWRNGVRQPRPERVLHLGDSTTFGVSVPAEETYAARLAEKLERCQPGRYESMTAAVPGYSSREGKRLVLEEKIFQRFPPSIVTIHFGWNDHWYQRPPRPVRLRGPRRLKAMLVERLALLQALDSMRGRVGQWWEGRRAGESRRTELEGFIADLRAGHPPQPEVERLNVAPQEFVTNLEILVSEARHVGARVVVLVPVFAGAESLRELLDRYPLLATEPFFFHTEYQDLIRRFAAEYRVPWIDLARDFEGRPGRLYVEGDPIHPNAAGHEIIAERLAELLCAEPEAPES